MTTVAIWLRTLRVTQWSKNAVVFAALVFGHPTITHAIWRSIAAFLVFCAISSSVYILNDWIDRDRDRLHPTKRNRPLAAGQVSSPAAITVSIALAAVAFLGSWLITPLLTLVILAYATLMLAYGMKLKSVVLVDAFVIAGGFVLRAVAGATAIEVPVSSWLMLCTMLLALFLAFGKRRSELVRLSDGAAAHRPTLAEYSLPMLDQFLIITATCSIMSYGIYSFTSDSVPENGSMMLTVPFVIFALFRYLLLVMAKGEGSTPETLLWKDTPLLLAVVGWSITVLTVMIIGT
ncbi:MAG: decaprenyl-phosphate phosphoribosyltransferase [Thermomicrobiales bacterium]|nr:decaprenyl-phosphate phosphoribosyltransferase [Thermomicrobiales bacterium]MCO5219870.1 decaprenyl-phosphate phosphoribosyltransferase [Thermomicrobiales bacterium]MCO5226396.1 decaprenyl-phosphate phosphoribosyltransferase [Thermomicrobiales bacterium]MCO5229426.1 decaprenyl-phosphate phosphoribosyltransferase [Thermomicrobiales bacterium]